MKPEAVITVPSAPEYLAIIRDAAGNMSRIFGMDESEQENIKLAVYEACTNVLRHTYHGDNEQEVTVRFCCNESFEVFIEDNGEKVPDEKLKGRNLDDLRPGGLGIHFIRRTFDIMAFVPEKKSGNCLHLVRHRRV